MYYSAGIHVKTTACSWRISWNLDNGQSRALCAGLFVRAGQLSLGGRLEPLCTTPNCSAGQKCRLSPDHVRDKEVDCFLWVAWADLCTVCLSYRNAKCRYSAIINELPILTTVKQRRAVHELFTIVRCSEGSEWIRHTDRNRHRETES